MPRLLRRFAWPHGRLACSLALAAGVVSAACGGEETFEDPPTEQSTDALREAEAGCQAAVARWQSCLTDVAEPVRLAQACVTAFNHTEATRLARANCDDLDARLAGLLPSNQKPAPQPRPNPTPVVTQPAPRPTVSNPTPVVVSPKPTPPPPRCTTPSGAVPAHVHECCELSADCRPSDSYVPYGPAPDMAATRRCVSPTVSRQGACRGAAECLSGRCVFANGANSPGICLARGESPPS
jgi:hypothetical protein